MIKEKILTGKTYLGIELGSTRIKACLIDDSATPVASGSYEWENKLENGYWTYSLDDIHNGLQSCFADLADNVKMQYDITLTTVGAIGVSAMNYRAMHLNPQAENVSQELLDKHYLRKHGKNAYYGQ